MGHSLKILGRTSSINVRKVLWTCQELGIDYVREDWGIGFKPTQSAEFLALNPNAQVPVLIDDHGVLWESNTICRYLIGLYQRHDLLPADLEALRHPREHRIELRALDHQQRHHDDRPRGHRERQQPAQHRHAPRQKHDRHHAGDQQVQRPVRAEMGEIGHDQNIRTGAAFMKADCAPRVTPLRQADDRPSSSQTR